MKNKTMVSFKIGIGLMERLIYQRNWQLFCWLCCFCMDVFPRNPLVKGNGVFRCKGESIKVV